MAQRCGWLSCDLLLVAPPESPRAAPIAASLASCADSFLGAAVAGWAAIDPACHAVETPSLDLLRIVAAQLQLDDDPLPAAFVAALHAAPASAAAACH
jgi:flagellar biosynthesis protein FlhG